MKRVLVFFLVVVSLISGCSFNVDVLTPAPTEADSKSTQTSTPDAVTPDPGATPVSTEAGECYTSPEAVAGVMFSSEFRIDLYGEKRIVQDDLKGNITELYVGNAIPYAHPSPDNRHILFVDRDCSGQIPGTTLGIRDALWIAEIPSGEPHLLYKHTSNFAGRAGPVFSPDGRFIASLEGSGFGDACLVDSRLIFFEVASDFQSVQPITQDQFTGFPVFNEGFVYPVEDGEWKTENLYLVTLDGTCNADKSQMGPFLFNLSDRTTAKASSAAAPLIAGDLGWGRIHGRITDAATGAPIEGATVTCSHSSYTSPVTCSGSATTNADGFFVLFEFEYVFFHDTDTIRLTIEAPGYQQQEITQTSFTMADMETNVALTPLP